MNHFIKSHAARLIAAAFPLVGAVSNASADVITDWNVKTSELITESKLGTPPAIRVMALVQIAGSGAVGSTAGLNPAASVDAAVAAAHRATLTKLLPAQQAAVVTAYTPRLAPV